MTPHAANTPGSSPNAAGATESPFPGGRRFEAEVDVAELDDRGRPGPAWIARTEFLSRGNVSLLSRRMVYANATLILAIHLLDAEPTLLAGTVVSCEYAGDGCNRLVLNLVPTPRTDDVSRWSLGRVSRRRYA
jgi:hypothetical protein